MMADSVYGTDRNYGQMMAAKDHYELLGIPQDSANDTINEAYRKHSSKWHSDKNTQYPDQANEVMSRLNVARDTLTDSAKRAAYDESLKAAELGAAGGSGAGATAAGATSTSGASSGGAEDSNQKVQELITALDREALNYTFHEYSTASVQNITRIRELFIGYGQEKPFADANALTATLRGSNLLAKDLGEQLKITDVFDEPKITLVMGSRGVALPKDFGAAKFPFFPKEADRMLKPGDEIPSDFAKRVLQGQLSSAKAKEKGHEGAYKNAAIFALKLLGTTAVAGSGLAALGVAAGAAFAAAGATIMTVAGFKFASLYKVTSVPSLLFANADTWGTLKLGPLLDPKRDIKIPIGKNRSIPVKGSFYGLMKFGTYAFVGVSAATNPVLGLTLGALTLLGSAGAIKIMKGLSVEGDKASIDFGNPAKDKRIAELKTLLNEQPQIFNTVLTIDATVWSNAGYGGILKEGRYMHNKKLSTLFTVRNLYQLAQTYPGIEEKQFYKFALTIGEFLSLDPYDRKVAYENTYRVAHRLKETDPTDFDIRYVPFWERVFITTSGASYDLEFFDRTVVNGREIADFVMNIAGVPFYMAAKYTGEAIAGSSRLMHAAQWVPGFLRAPENASYNHHKTVVSYWLASALALASGPITAVTSIDDLWNKLWSSPPKAEAKAGGSSAGGSPADTLKKLDEQLARARAEKAAAGAAAATGAPSASPAAAPVAPITAPASADRAAAIKAQVATFEQSPVGTAITADPKASPIFAKPLTAGDFCTISGLAQVYEAAASGRVANDGQKVTPEMVALYNAQTTECGQVFAGQAGPSVNKQGSLSPAITRALAHAKQFSVRPK